MIFIIDINHCVRRRVLLLGVLHVRPEGGDSGEGAQRGD